MTPERRALLLVLVGLALILPTALTRWFLANFEQRTETVPVGYSAQARRNDLLAAERFLNRLEIPVESVSGRGLLRDLPPIRDSLVVRGLGPMNVQRRVGLRDWLAAGGHLVVTASQTRDEDRQRGEFLDELGIRLLTEEAERLQAADEGEVVALVSTPRQSRPLSVAFAAEYYLQSEGKAEFEARAGGRLRLVRRSVGDGSLTVMSDGGFMTNAAIGEKDHALFTAELTIPRSGGKVWLLYDSGVPWLGALLWSVAPHALASVVVLSVVWLWSLGGRLGPLAPAPVRRRRDLLEHLQASGGFLWRHDRAARLVETSRRRILVAWLRRHPSLGRSDTRAQLASIAAAVRRPADAVTRALFSQAEDRHGLVEQARLLQSMWRRTGGAGQKTEDRGQKTEGRRQKLGAEYSVGNDSETTYTP